ncbi:hypothetical protein K2X05_14385 [bacterium]|nr:hypothetical protein [bacterium]
MKLWIAPYREEGFLIKLQSKDFSAGYADCRPWALFGDGTVKSQIDKLKNRRLSSLLKRSLFFAHIDGVAREQKKSLWNQNLSLRSHYTVLDINQLKSEDLLERIRAKGFRTLKLKVGFNIEQELSLCHKLAEKNWFRLRLDFNGRSTSPHFLQRMGSLFLSQIDFIEDPAMYDEQRWKQLEVSHSVKLAVDQAAEPHQTISRHRIKIIKPARENNLARAQDVITNSLDHPVGQAFAALQAQKSVEKLNRQYKDFGLQSAHLFSASSYFSEMSTQDAFFRAIPGYGIGFDDLLEGESWIPL